MAGISSLGIGSGIDIASLVSQLVAAERAPVESRLNRNEMEVQTRLSAYGSLKSVLGTFREKVAALTDIDAFAEMKASSSDAEAVGISAAAGAPVGSFDISVSNLAQAQSVASRPFDSTTAAVGSGTLSFRFGAVTVEDVSGAVTGFTQNAERPVATVAIPADATSLEAVRDAVNEADIGVRASIIDDGSGERLVFDAEDSGAANGFIVEVADDDGNDTDAAGLSQLAFNQDAASLERTRAGEDAAFTVNGLDIVRTSNEISDAIEGVTLDLKQETESPVDIEITRDTGAVRGKIEDFVDAYNEYRKQIDALTGYNPETQQGGALQGSAVIRSLNNNIRQLTTRVVDVLDGRAVRSLADLGILSTREGSLEIDDAKLDEALEKHFDEVGALFASTGLVDGNGFEYLGSNGTTSPGDYDVAITQVAEQAAIQGAALGSAPSGANPLTIDAGNDELVLEIDGEQTGSIRIAQGDYTSGDALAAELQARINGDHNLQDKGITVTISYDDASNRFEIASSRYGSESKVEIVSVDTDTAATIGFSAGQTDTGQDVAGTIDGRTAGGVGQVLTVADGDGDAEGLRLRVFAETTGDLGSVTFSRGITAALDDALGNLLESDGVLASTTESLEKRLDRIASERIDLDRRMGQVERRYTADFIAMDQLVAQLNRTSSFLGTQLASLEMLASSSALKR